MSKENTQQAVLAGVWERIGNNRLLMIGLVGVVALLALQLLWPSQSLQQPLPDAIQVSKGDSADRGLQSLSDYRAALEQQLASTMASIAGVGEVKVMLSLEGTPEAIPAMNTQTSQKTTEEQDSNGGTRVTREETHQSTLLTASDNNLVMLQENLPPVTGVVIVAQGAENPSIRLTLTRVAQTVLNIAAHRIEVIPGK